MNSTFIIDKIKNETKKHFNLEDDVKIIITHFEEEKLEKLLFDAKFTLGLFKVLRDPDKTQFVNDQTKKEAMTSLSNLTSLLKDTIPETETSFHLKYLNLNSMDINSLIRLLEDLNIIKLYYNEKKRK